MPLEMIVEKQKPIGLYRQMRSYPEYDIEPVLRGPTHGPHDQKNFYPHKHTHAPIFQKRRYGEKKDFSEEYVSIPRRHRESPIYKEITFDITDPKTISSAPATEQIRYKGHEINFTALDGKIAVYERDGNVIKLYGTRKTEGVVSAERLRRFAQGSVQNLRDLNAEAIVLYETKLTYADAAAEQVAAELVPPKVEDALIPAKRDVIEFLLPPVESYATGGDLVGYY